MRTSAFDTVFDTVVIGQANISKVSFDLAVSSILEFARLRQSHYIVTPNTDHILQLESDAELRAAYADATLVVCDGRPLLWASYLLGTPLPEVVTGADLMPALCQAGAGLGLKIAIIGGPPGSAELAGKNLVARYPGIRVEWTYCPPMGFEKDPHQSDFIVSSLNERDVDLVFVGVGAPKQEKWIHLHQSRLRVGVLLGIGAAIEFVAGTLPRAPKFMRRLGLEWLFRLWQQPRRLFIRYFKDTFFAVIVLRQLLKK